MILGKTLPLLLLLLLAGATSTAAASPPSRSLITGEEVGYFGSAALAHRLSVFVYSDVAARAGNRVTVCVRGRCEQARGHSGRTAWYSASFATPPLPMGAPVTFTVVASSFTRRAKVTVTKSLLCMHNDGSTPQA